MECFHGGSLGAPVEGLRDPEEFEAAGQAEFCRIFLAQPPSLFFSGTTGPIGPFCMVAVSLCFMRTSCKASRDPLHARRQLSPTISLLVLFELVSKS